MHQTFSPANTHLRTLTEVIYLHSVHLKRDVSITILLPENSRDHFQNLPLVLFQDGQDFGALRLSETITGMIHKGEIPPLIIAGIHANEKRIYEYGVAAEADYMGRGDLAGAHTRFAIDELLPYLKQHYPVGEGRHGIAGFSLGGLMAFDIAWNYPALFSHAGVFSGSLWWRRKAFGDDYIDSDRIMHEQIRCTLQKPDLKCWFQTGTHDETSDRNGDGVIDSIEDTLDCIAELERKGLQWNKDVFYKEVEGGEHNPHTWSQVMPEFLKWVFEV